MCVCVESEYLISKEPSGPVGVSQYLTLNEEMTGLLLRLTMRIIYAPTQWFVELMLVLCWLG